MRIKSLLVLCSFLVLAACSEGPGTPFPIASGPLKPDEIAVAGFGRTALMARVFDVVSQDASSDTGLAGPVQPMPVDIVSSYAAGKFHATGGPYSVRFAVRQASFTVRSATPGNTNPGFFSFMKSDGDNAELSVNLNVMIAANQINGASSTITAVAQQSQQVPFAGTPEEHRAAYVALMGRALKALDAEINRQLPTYFGPLVVR